MQPVGCDINLYRGDDFEMLLRIRTGVLNTVDNTYTPGDYLDLTDWVGRAQVRSTEDSTAVIATFQVVNLAQEGDTLGGVRLSLTGATTAAINVSGVWDLQFTDPDGRVHTYLKGKVGLSKDVTR